MQPPLPKSMEILLVDDDPVMRHLLRRWLEQAGYLVRVAKNGEEAKTAVDQQCPDLVVTDLEMPLLNGIQLCQWLRQRDLPHQIYTILLTSHERSESLIRGLEAGADDFLKKPVDHDELIARLHRGVQIQQLHSQLNNAANYDLLTGLANRRAFQEQLAREWSRATRHGGNLSCVMVDIDYFKRINDTHGHPAGDETLREVARLIRSNLRVSDIACRYGGDEFCLLLPETDQRGALVLAGRLLEAVAGAKVTDGETEFRLTASFGVMQRSANMTEPAQLVRRADEALLRAKQAGRNQVIVADPDAGGDAADSPSPSEDSEPEMPRPDSADSLE